MSGKNLNVHHVYYLENRDAWDYPDSALITLCRPCHEEQHAIYGNKYRKTEDRIPELFRQIKESANSLRSLDAKINGKEIH
jgi:5-methylcytosine-specific restriction endonuclease McrA